MVVAPAYPVLRLNIQKKRRDHTDGLLTADVANLGLGDQELMELCVFGALLQQGTRNIKVPSQFIRVPCQGARRVSNHTVHRDIAQMGYKGVLNGVADLNSVTVGCDPNLSYSSVYQEYCCGPCIQFKLWSQCLPASTGDAECRGQGDLEMLPENRPFLVRHDLLRLVVLLHFGILLDHGDVSGVGVALLARRGVLAL